VVVVLLEGGWVAHDADLHDVAADDVTILGARGLHEGRETCTGDGPADPRPCVATP
jgi:hypothetical protein